MATVTDRRGRGLGRWLLQEVALLGATAGDNAIDLYAKPESVAFYTRLGFALVAHTYTGNDHMRLSLA